MKISEATFKQKIISLGLLDDRVWSVRPYGETFKTQLQYPPEGGFVDEIKTCGHTRRATREEIEKAILTEFDGLYHYRYLDVLDDIVRVINKWFKYATVGEVIVFCRLLGIKSDVTWYKIPVLFLKNKPEQLSNALLVAAGKFEE